MLSQALGQHWALTVIAQQLVQSGNGRQLWRVVTSDGPVAVKLAPAAPPGLAAMHDLARGGFPHLPTLRLTTGGLNHADLNGQVAWVMEWIDGVEPPNTPAIHGELGCIAAALNASDVVAQPRAQSVRDVMADLQGRPAPGPEYRQLVDGLAILDGQPEALVHGEINRANARLTSDGRIVVLDWDDVGRGVRWLDAGYPLIHVFLGEDLTFDQASATAFYAGFAHKEPAHIWAAATLHALRYLPWGDSEARWRRLLYAQEHRDELLACLGA